ncbi:DUF305 domain-containing protein [Nonomuraea soli]|uniref:Uncharacterized protein (DUF305 family) n=1 Tax=Nonomuraea soli TaxID=1032476 RepID=A0A7W0HRD4_9ACTN|nr:DUF305 domain-containing protein [Nonomuraea soli]MBA2892884.1 uncharacterized protein (DUF305 family) [Nonomuraea soli]
MFKRTIVAVAGALALAACGNTSTTVTPATPASSPAASAASFNDADVMFAQMMIPHHRQAVRMADLAATRAADPEIKELAGRIKAAQDPEITTLTGWLTAWGEPVEAPMHHGMPGMLSDDDMARLGAAQGAAFDRLFAEQMIAHHEGAIEMAETERSDGRDPAAKALAKEIAEAQKAEVAQLRKILERI